MTLIFTIVVLGQALYRLVMQPETERLAEEYWHACLLK